MSGIRVGIVGGGASGLIAAITAAKNGAQVTVLEHKDRVGKKILMTGNGKCNLTNISDYHGKYYSDSEESLAKIHKALSTFGSRETIQFFNELGLYTKEKRDGGVYPMSEQATSVLDVLRSECEHYKVKLLTDCEVQNIDTVKDIKVCVTRYIRCDVEPKENTKKNKKNTKQSKSEIIDEKQEVFTYDRLILATGGKAAAVSGSDGSGYKLARTLGHSIITPLPALVQLKCEGDYFKAISGVRVQSEMELFIDKMLVATEEGELQLTDYGISGIPVFQFSRRVSRALYDKKSCVVKINFIPQVTGNIDFEAYSYKCMEELLGGMVNKKIATLICKMENISPKMTISLLGTEKANKCIQRLRSFEVKVVATNSFDNAQVCTGGVPVTEVSDTFESMKKRNVYLVGELLDCDAICGGYNLQWAWTSGIIAGRAVCE